MSTYHLSVITPRGKVFEGDVRSAIVPGLHGEFGVLASHAPMIASAAIGVLKIEDAEGTHYFALGNGVMEVGENQATLLAEIVEPVANHEEAKKRAGEIKVDLAKSSAVL